MKTLYIISVAFATYLVVSNKKTLGWNVCDII